MKAVIYEEYGTADVLKTIDIDKPTPNEYELLIKIKASTVTRADTIMRECLSFTGRLIIGLFKPKKKYQILGIEFSGIVEGTGSKVIKYKIGDELFGFSGFNVGCYAQYLTISENSSVCTKPSNLSFDESVSIVDGATTSHYFLIQRAKLKAKQKILIIGASGSIGSYAVQISKQIGAEATGVCSEKNIDFVKGLGADIVIDYTKEDYTKNCKKYDIIFDTVGASRYKECKKILSGNGKYLVTSGGMIGLYIMNFWTKLFCKKKLIYGMSVEKKQALKFVKDLAESCSIQPIIDRYYQLEQASEAHSYVEAGHKRGNVVLSIDS